MAGIPSLAHLMLLHKTSWPLRTPHEEWGEIVLISISFPEGATLPLVAPLGKK